MKILFLTDNWFPNMTTNAICVKNIAEELIAKGHEIYVCAYGDDNQTKERYGIQFSYIIPSLARRFLNDAQYKYKKGVKSKLWAIIGKTLNRLRRFILLPWYPIVSFSVAKRWLQKMNDLIVSEGIETVVSVVCPDDSFYAGFLIKSKHQNIKWIVYNIDAGSNVLKGSSFEWLKHLLQRKAVKWENNVLKQADKIIVMEGHSDYYKNILNEVNKQKLNIADVPLLSKTPNLEQHTIENTEKSVQKIVYTGNMNGVYYDPKPLCELFIEYSSIRSAELHLYGPSNHSEYLRRIMDKHENIVWHGMIPHDEVVRVQSEADVLIYYKCEPLDSVSGKLFEYLLWSKPIIYLGHLNDINSNQLSKYKHGLSLNINESVVSNAKSMDCFLSDKKRKELISKEDIEKSYLLCLPKTTAKIIAE